MKHKHCEVIKAYADGAEVQTSINGGPWFNDNSPSFSNQCQYRIKPSAPKWLETTMTDSQLLNYHCSMPSAQDLRDIANAALAHSLETGQVVLPGSERDMKVAKATAMNFGESQLSDTEAWFIISEIKK